MRLPAIAWAASLTVWLAYSLPAAAADAAQGAVAYEAHCTGCHSLHANRIGPRHQGIIGRRAGSLPDFDYSPSLRRANFVWTEALVARWLADPEKLVPGQKMGFSISDEATREDIAAFLAEESGTR